MAKKRENQFLSFIAVIILLVFVGVIFIVLGSRNLYKNTSNNQQTSSQTYKSETLKLTINVPSEFQVEEKFAEIHLTKNVKGEIIIDRTGTNFSNTDDYLNDLSVKNKISVEMKKKLVINGLNAVNILIKHPVSGVPDNEAYLIYINNFVYSLSTSSEALFDDLDKIALSFKYTP